MLNINLIRKITSIVLFAVVFAFLLGTGLTFEGLVRIEAEASDDIDAGVIDVDPSKIYPPVDASKPMPGKTEIMPLTPAELNAVNVKVNEAWVIFPDAQPEIDSNGRTILPIRPVALAAGFEVSWGGDLAAEQIPSWVIDKSKYVKIINKKNNKTVELIINSNVIQVDGIEKTIDTEPVIKNGRTYLPLRAVGESLGGTVSWDSVDRIANLTI